MTEKDNVVIGNFGRRQERTTQTGPGIPAYTDVSELSREGRIDLTFEQVMHYQSLIYAGGLSSEEVRAYEDSVDNALGLLSPDEQGEVLRRIDATKVKKFREEEEMSTNTEASGSDYRIITADERVAMDPRGLRRFTKLGANHFIVKAIPEAEVTAESVLNVDLEGEENG